MAPQTFAQSRPSVSGQTRLPITVAEDAVPADLSISEDTASVSGGTVGTGAPSSYAPAPRAPVAPVTASAAPDARSMTAPAPANLSSSTFPPNANMMALPPGGPSFEVKAEIQQLKVGIPAAERRLYARAAAAFPHFCQDWGRMLRDREENNLASLNWREKGGYETATYVGYSPIKTCQCKESAEGIPLGKVTYDEEDYYVVGKTVDAAKHAPPRVTRIVPTLEIFSWDHNKWFY
ncbi:MAG TPA: hypothetical protein VMF50_16780 [Candidatus Binataceae bacterium]|nr:hypothetical protein [Candidatus Binataceae bacterium]